MVSRNASRSTQRHATAAFAAACACALAVSCARSPQLDYVLIEQRALDLKANAPATAELALNPGAYTLSIREDGVDAAVSVKLGDSLVRTREPVARHGTHLIHVEIPAAGKAQIAVSIDQRTAQAGRALLEVRQWRRPITAAPTEHERADQAFARAVRVDTPGGQADTQEMIAAFETARAHYTAAHARIDTARTRHALAAIHYLELSSWLDAEEHAAAAARAFESADDRVGAARALIVLAAAQLERANEISSLQDRPTREALLRSADDVLAQSVGQLRDAGESVDQADAMNLRGIGRWYARDFVAARAHFLQALTTARKRRDALIETKALGNLAWLDFVSGRPRDAAEEYRQLLSSVSPLHESHAYSAHAGNYALVLATLGDFDGAIKLHAEILDRATAAHDEPMRMQQLVAIGSLALRRGDARHAISVARTALGLPDGLKDRTQHNSALRVAGQAALQLADPAAAREYFTQLLDRSIGGREIAQVRVFLAQSHRKLGRLREAEMQLSQALEEDEGDEWIRAQALTERAQISLARGDAASAERDLNTADAAYSAIGLDTPRIETCTLLAHARNQLGKHDTALEAADEAIRLVRTIRSATADPDVRATFLAAQYAPYEAKIQILMTRSSPARIAEPDIWAAIATAENARAQMLNDLRVAMPVRDRAEDAAVARARDMLVAQRALLERRLQRSHADDPAVQEIRREIAEAATRLSALSARSAESAETRAASESQPAELVDATRYRRLVNSLPTTTAVAYFFVGEQHTHMWLIQGASTTHYSLPGRRELDDDVRRFVGLGVASNLAPGRFGETSPALRRIVGVLKATRAPRIVIFADGPLNSLPFAALYTESANRRSYLVEGASLLYMPSLAAAVSRQGAAQMRPRSRVAVVSDPVYASDDVRLAAAGRSPSHLRGVANDDLTRLPYSNAEAKEIKRLYRSNQVIELSGFDATAAAVAKLPFADLRVLHFAAHAIARDDDPRLSALYLTAYDDRLTPLENRAITAEAVLRLQMRADLVVLSGCSTAGGAPIAGEGMLGLTHSFLANGSRSVVASLWPVDDAQTARLMARFHAAYRAGADASAAMAIAQRASVAESQDARLIQNWSSFVVRGSDLFLDDTKRGVSQ